MTNPVVKAKNTKASASLGYHVFDSRMAANSYGFESLALIVSSLRRVADGYRVIRFAQFSETDEDTPRSMRPVLALIMAVCLVSGGVAAPDETSRPVVPSSGIFPAGKPSAYGDDEFFVPEIFQGHLSTTLERNAVRLAINPHLGDVRNKEYMRLTTGLRYGLTENLEVSVTSDLYFSHGYGEIRAFKDYGVANLNLGAKINLGEPFLAGWKVGAGADYLFPTGRPPAELTDGLRHFMPYLTFSHRLKLHPALRIFWGVRLDDVVETSVQGTFGKNAFQDSSTGITGGFVIDRKNWHYTFEAAYDTTRLLGRTATDVYTYRPGVLWEIPKRNNPQIMSNWLVGLAINSTFAPGSRSLGASFRLRYRRDFKNLFRHISSVSVVAGTP